MSLALSKARGEQCEQQRPGWWIGTVLQDVRYALRGFGRNPLFSISVVATLALGIGATTAVLVWSIASCFARCLIAIPTGLSR